MEASDEAGHMAYTLYIKEHRALPICRPGQPLGPGPQEFTQAPLYYLIGALLIAPIDTSNASDFFIPRPQAPIGRADRMGPKNGWEIRGRRDFPWTQTRLALSILRLWSMLLGLGTLLLISALARRIGPPDRAREALALAWVALNPMFLFIANAVNNDNLIIFCATATLFAWHRARAPQAGPGADLLAGFALGCALLAKASGILLVPIAALAYAGARRPHALRWRGLALCGLTALLIAAPWFIWNAVHYGDPLGLSIHKAFAHLRPEPLTWALIQEASGFIKSYWGVFGMFNVIYSDGVYGMFYGLTAMAVAVIGVARWRRQQSGDLPDILIAFSLLTLLGVALWTRTVWASQGRLLFPALGFHALLVAGSFDALPRPLRHIAAVALPLLLGGAALWAALVIIPAAY